MEKLKMEKLKNDLEKGIMRVKISNKIIKEWNKMYNKNVYKIGIFYFETKNNSIFDKILNYVWKKI